MRILFFLLIVCSSVLSYGQYASYQDQYDKVKMGFDLPMSMYNGTLMFISALAEYEIKMSFSQESERLAIMKQKSFESAQCQNCELYKKLSTEDPLSYIFEVIEEGDVFYIKQEESSFYLEHYRE